MNRVQLRALRQCGRNQKGEIFEERSDRARILVGLGRAEYLTRDMTAEAPPVTKPAVVAQDSLEPAKKTRGRPRKAATDNQDAATHTDPASITGVINTSTYSEPRETTDGGRASSSDYSSSSDSSSSSGSYE